MAMRVTICFGLTSQFQPKRLIQTMFQLGHHQHASRFMRLLGMQDMFEKELRQADVQKGQDLAAWRALMRTKEEEVGRRLGGFNKGEKTELVRELDWGTRTILRHAEGYYYVEGASPLYKVFFAEDQEEEQDEDILLEGLAF